MERCGGLGELVVGVRVGVGVGVRVGVVPRVGVAPRGCGWIGLEV